MMTYTVQFDECTRAIRQCRLAESRGQQERAAYYAGVAAALAWSIEAERQAPGPFIRGVESLALNH
jgi:hypothetical protein